MTHNHGTFIHYGYFRIVIVCIVQHLRVEYNTEFWSLKHQQDVDRLYLFKIANNFFSIEQIIKSAHII